MAGQFSYAIAESESTKSANHAQWSVGGTRQRRQTTEEGKRVCAFGCEENEPVAILSPLPSFLPILPSLHPFRTSAGNFIPSAIFQIFSP